MNARANRIPRIVPTRPGMLHRARRAARRLYSEWLLRNLGRQLRQVERKQKRRRAEASADARLHRGRYSPLLIAQLMQLSRDAETLEARMAEVRGELDALVLHA